MEPKTQILLKKATYELWDYFSRLGGMGRPYGMSDSEIFIYVIVKAIEHIAPDIEHGYYIDPQLLEALDHAGNLSDSVQNIISEIDINTDNLFTELSVYHDIYSQKLLKSEFKLSNRWNELTTIISRFKFDAWCKKNVIVHQTPKIVTLSNFCIDIDHYDGTFKVSLDNTIIQDRFGFSINQNGIISFGGPVIPYRITTVAKHDLTDETNLAIKVLLEKIFPKIKPLGYDEQSEEMITCLSHRVIDRITNREEYLAKMEEISTPGFSISQKVMPTKWPESY